MRASDRKLSGALREAGFQALAARAAKGEFNEFFGDHALPMHELIGELERAAQAAKDPRIERAAAKLVGALVSGEFDATQAEASEWAHSEEGLAIAQELRGS